MTARMKQQTGGRLPVLIKMNVMDFTEGGITVDEAVNIVEVWLPWLGRGRGIGRWDRACHELAGTRKTK